MYSERIDKYYVGSTDNLEWRQQRHNLGWGRYTKRGIPWKLVYYERFKTKYEALKRERKIKKKKSRNYVEEMIHSGGRPE